MKAIIYPSKISGEISAPPSKSYTHRAVILASLADGKSQIKNALISDDTKATISACRLLGAKIRLKGKSIEIEGNSGHFPQKSSVTQINCGLSGTTIRLITGIAALSPFKVILTGEKRLKTRPIGELVRTLKFLGVDINASQNGQFPPVTIKGGNYKGGKIMISGNTSSQFVSSLLLIAPFAKKDTTLIVKDLKSKPYVNITIDMMKTFGVKVEQNGNTYKVKTGQKYKSQNYTVEGDYSSASYFFAGAVVTDSNISVENLNSNSVQGDKYFLDILIKMGCQVSKNKKAITVIGNKLCGIDVDLGNYPDIVPTLAVVAAKALGNTSITNIAHLRTKESNRIQALENELKKMKVQVESNMDILRIQGPALSTQSVIINTYNDHRIAMSFAIAGLAADGETIINNAEVVNKSYPNFWKDLKKLGAKLTFIPDRKAKTIPDRYKQ